MARLFTPQEVDALLPDLSTLMGHAMIRHQEGLALRARLVEERERIRLTGGAAVDRRDWKARVERLDGLRIEVRSALEEIERIGGVVKDLALGLVDFRGRVPGQAGREAVNLCWKHGEDRVRFWHGLDEGFAQRKCIG